MAVSATPGPRNESSTAKADGLLPSGSIVGIVGQALLTAAGFEAKTFLGGISAAGTTQATATALSKQVNLITTSTSGAGVILMALVFVAGACVEILVMNAGANALLVYPPSGSLINALAANAAFSIAAGAAARFYQISATAWRTA